MVGLIFYIAILFIPLVWLCYNYIKLTKKPNIGDIYVYRGSEDPFDTSEPHEVTVLEVRGKYVRIHRPTWNIFKYDSMMISTLNICYKKKD
jgi:hypothetical protein